jgi:hypothetical protein
MLCGTARNRGISEESAGRVSGGLKGQQTGQLRRCRGVLLALPGIDLWAILCSRRHASSSASPRTMMQQAAAREILSRLEPIEKTSVELFVPGHSVGAVR